MEWIKFDEEKIPLYDEPVLLSVKRENGKRYVTTGIYDTGYKKFYKNRLPFVGSPYEYEIFGTVTHWMHYPEPADDLEDLPHEEKVKVLREKLKELNGKVSDQWYEDTEKAISELEEGNVWSAMRVLMFCLMDIPKENRPMPKKCPVCNGQGNIHPDINSMATCPRCHGAGYLDVVE